MLLAMDGTQTLVAAKQAPRTQTYVCPGCLAPVHLKRGRIITAHFAHQAGQVCTSFSEGETTEHLLGKQQLAAWFAASGLSVQLEAPLSALHQRPDLLVQQPGHAPLAIEFQCSPLAVERLAERTQGYVEHGYRVLWLLGTPYQHHLQRHAKALKFLQYHPHWGCYVAFWQTQTNGLCLLYNLLTLDGEALSYQRQYFPSASQSVQSIWQFRPVLTAPLPVAMHWQHYQRQVVLARLRRQPQLQALQTRCYEHGGTLAQLPAWVVPMQAAWPLLAGPYLAWYVELFLTLRAQPLEISAAKLTSILTTTLTEQLAPRGALTPLAMLTGQLVAHVQTALVAAQVIQAIPAGWRLRPAQLRWQKNAQY